MKSESLNSHTILDGLATAVIVLDDSLSITYVNAAAESLLSMGWRRAVGVPLDQVVEVPALMRNRLLETLATGHAFTDRSAVIHIPAEPELTVDYTVSPLTDNHGNRRLLVELTQIDRHLRIAREDALLAQNHAMRILVRGLAHEIKNPLGGLRGAAQLLERELPEPALREYTQVIIREADRLQNLMDRMLGPNNRPQMRAVNIHEVTERVRQLIGAESGPGLEIHTDYDPSIPPLTADPEWLIQATLNVARNAMQALQGRGNLTLRTRTLRRFTIGHTLHRLVVRIDVTDDGPGIPPEMLENIFYPMVTGRADGTGIGLSIAQMLVNQHGGLIECRSRPGETTFTILLPLERNGDNER